jgi:MFS family permease
MPFLYRFIQTPEQLFLIRVVHGMATAIYGPVTLAYVAEQASGRRAEGLGWFGIARSGGYILGPALAGWLLLFVEAVTVYTIIGLMSCAIFVPILSLTERSNRAMHAASLRQHVSQAFIAGAKTPRLWLAAILEATVYVALYAMKAFLPIYALSIGINVAMVGTFFAVQEMVVAAAKPFGGHFADRVGYIPATGLGMLRIGIALPLLGIISDLWSLIALAILLGAGQALVFPSTTALVAVQIDAGHIGAGMGLLGTLQNGGKVLGPVLGGLLVASLGYEPIFVLMGLGACRRAHR